MDDELTPEQRFAAEDAEVTVTRDLQRGVPTDEIVAKLVRLDWRPDAAMALIQSIAEELRQYAESPEARRALIRRQIRLAVGGAVMFFAGTAFFASTLLFAFAGPTWIILPWGFMAVGIALFARGLSRWRRYRKDDLSGI